MALVLKDRVKETTTSTGTGTITLAGASTGFQSFSVIGNGNATYYTIYDPVTGAWEVGIGTYTASGTTLSRDTVLESSNSGSLVPFGAGVKDVFVTYPAERSVYLDTAGSAVTVLDIGTLGVSTANISSANITAGTISTTPTASNDLVNKTYVDGIAAQGISYHTPVKYEVPNTTGNLNATYNQPGGPGVGVGATLTNAGTLAAFAPDGPTASPGDRILVYNQTNAFENGVYTVTTVGNGSTPWVLTRASDADTYGVKSPTSLGGGDAFFVTSGNTGAGETYVCNNASTITFGTTGITFAQIASAQVYSAGAGLTLSNLVFSITPVGTAGTYGGAASVPVFTTNAYGQITGVTPTAIAISGAAVSGNIAGSAGSVANALTAGTYLTATGTFDGSVARTFSVDATSANTASKVVARDASGNFSAGTITATLSGNATTATTATNIAGGAANQIVYQSGAGTTTFVTAPTTSSTYLGWNGSAFTWSAFATPNSLTFNNGGAGGASGSTFNGSSALTVSYNTVGAPSTTGTNATGTWGISISGNAATATSATSATTATNLAGGSAGTVPYQSAAGVTAMLAAGTSGQYLQSNGAAAPSWATLGNGTLTMAVSGTGLSGSASFTANQSGNSTFTVTSNATSANTASTIVARDASGNFSAGTITATLSGSASSVANSVTFNNSGSGAASGSTFNGSSALTVSANTIGAPLSNGTYANGTWGINITGNAATATTANALNSANNYSVNQLTNNTWYNYNDNDRNANSATYYPNASTRAFRLAFVNSSSVGTGGNYAGLMQFNPWDGTTSSTGDASYQMAWGSTAANSGGVPQLRIRKGIDTSWNAWIDILTSSNYNSYALPLSGGTMTGNITVSSTSVGAQFGNLSIGFGGLFNTLQTKDGSSALFLNYSSTGNIDLGTGGGYTTINQSTRSPIFYDSNNTAYYADPASTSSFFRLTIADNTANTNILDASGNSFQGVNVRLPGRLIAGSSGGGYPGFGYNVVPTSTGLQYYAGDQAWWINYGNSSSLSFWFAPSGSGGATISSSTRLGYFDTSANFWSTTSARAPIFYDSDDTSFFVNPASTSALNAVSYYGLQAWVSDSVYALGTPTYGYRFNNNANTINAFIINNSGDTTSYASSRAPIFYDSNDTNYYVNPNSTSLIYALNVYGGGLYDTQTGFRLSLPGGGAYATTTSSVSGAIKVRIPTAALGSNTMVGFDVEVYTYDGLSFTIRCGGYNYSDASKTWYNVFAYMVSGARPGLTVRFGWDGTSQCIWIGELGSSWVYPQVAVTNFMGGYSNYNAATWATGWTVSFETSSFYSVSQTATVYPLPYSTNNTSNLYAATLYDSDNTAYYVNPASGAYLYSLQLSGAAYFFPNNWIQLNGGYGLYAPSVNAAHFYPNNASSYGTWSISGSRGGWGGIYDSYGAVNYGMYDSGGNGGVYREANARWYFYYNLSNDCMGIGTASTSASYSLYLTKGVYAQSRIDATIYYDTNDTAYYIDPNGGSNLNVVGAIRLYAGYDAGVSYSISCSNWFRSSGDSGWYNSSYTGGIYMVDTTWVRVYNSKAFYVENQIAATGNVTAYYSDERLKTKVGRIENALDKVRSLEGFLYVNNDLAKANGYTSDRVQVALSAQQVQRVQPEVVSLAPFDMHTDEFSGEITSKSGENYLTVDYERLVPLLVEAIKELSAKVDALH